ADVIVHACVEADARNCRPPLGAREAERVARSIADKKPRIGCNAVPEPAPTVVVLPWDEPIPLERSDGGPAPFPGGVFPETLERFVDEAERATQTPRDLSAMLVLGALSTAVGGKSFVEPRPGYREPLNTYLTVALDSGELKSSVKSLVFAPVD